MTRDHLNGFLLGYTFYPFPIYVPAPYKGWSSAKRNAYGCGLLAGWLSLLAFAGIGLTWVFP